jgi:hypothetical protein
VFDQTRKDKHWGRRKLKRDMFQLTRSADIKLNERV